MDHPISLLPATKVEFEWAQSAVAAFHYLHAKVDPRSRPLAYIVRMRGLALGTLIFGRSEATRCYRGGLTYGSLSDVQTGRAQFDRWEILNLARVWLDPKLQRGGELCDPEIIPGFVDRFGQWRSALASWLIAATLARVNFDYLDSRPPCFLDQPYQLRAVLSYCDTRLHRGTIYRAAGFRLARKNADGIETWWTQAVRPLTGDEDAHIRRRSSDDERAKTIRDRLTLTSGSEPAILPP